MITYASFLKHPIDKTLEPGSVADPDPGSGAFLTPGSGIRDPGFEMGKKSISGFRELRNNFLG
jgi:hypothetical protein